MHTEAALKAHYTDVRRRIWTAQPKPKPKPAQDHIRLVVVNEPERPTWKRTRTNFDAHVIEFYFARARAGSPMRAYIRSRAEELGYDYKRIVSKGRTRELAYARQLIMWEVKHLWPAVSFPELGRMFGGRDHTTVLHAMRKMNALYEAGAIQMPVRPT